jgi:hypothetical protein
LGQPAQGDTILKRDHEVVFLDELLLGCTPWNQRRLFRFQPVATDWLILQKGPVFNRFLL